MLQPGVPAAVIQGDNFQHFYQPPQVEKGQRRWNSQYANVASGGYGQPPDQAGDYQQMDMNYPYQDGQMQAHMIMFPAQCKPEEPALTYAQAASGQRPVPSQPSPNQPKAQRKLTDMGVHPMMPIQAYIPMGTVPTPTFEMFYGDAVNRIADAQSLIASLKYSNDRLKGMVKEMYPNEQHSDAPYVYVRQHPQPNQPNILIVIAIIGMRPQSRIIWNGGLYTPVHKGQNGINPVFTQLMHMQEGQQFEVIHMSTRASVYQLYPGDPGYIDIQNAMQFRKDNPEFYGNEVPLKYYWKKYRDQALLKNNPEVYGKLIRKQDVVLEKSQAGANPGDSQTEHPDQHLKKNNKPKVQKELPSETKALASGQVVQQNKALIQSREQRPDSSPLDPSKPPLYKEVFYEQIGTFNPKFREYQVFKMNVNVQQIPKTKFVKAAGMRYKEVEDDSRLRKYKKDHAQRKMERESPKLSLQQRLYFQEYDEMNPRPEDYDQYGQDQGEDMVDKDVSQLQGTWQHKKPKQKRLNGQPDGKKRPGRPRKQVSEEVQTEPMQGSAMMAKQPRQIAFGPQPPGQNQLLFP
jgi:hypothetical protein